MRDKLTRTVALTLMLGFMVSLFSGCFLKKKLVDDHVTDGPGMVNYNGLLLNALIGDWADEDQNYRLMIGNNSTISIYYGDTPLLENAALNLYATSEDTNEYNELSINPNTWTDEADKGAQITNAYHEDGTITLELAFDDGTEADIAFHWFYREPEMLDGPGMVYEGAPLDEAITGCWYSKDGRFVLDFNGKRADFLVDGKMLSSKEPGYYFVDHDFSAGDDLNERCELIPFSGPEIKDENYETILLIDEMWYQAEQITMNITWPDGKAEEVIFRKQDDSMPAGEWETEQTPQPSLEADSEPSEAKSAQQSQEQQDEIAQITMEMQKGDEGMSATFDRLPTTAEEFSALAEGKLTNPENTCALFLCALNIYIQDKDAGIEAVNLLRGPRPLNNYDIQFLRDRLRDKTYLPLAYFDGAMPENSYAPSEPYTLRLYADSRPQDCEAGYMRLFLKTAGADSPRPIKLRQKGEEWFLWEYSSILSGIRIPASADPWA